ncbi:HUIPC motif thioredoxin-like (seleno)protein [Desulfotomaculum copahuensis]|uniref:Thioredoxin-like fold domain-containing protein n=1 Tax=Desulfotomaculum copahuensis TaxID=1838280 RepID=A0A1B7LIK5_9FIRM|nr:hypothetical protein [Desulfotomaculum copahuensis]OAT86137.1 hypothetical protein A6M21_04285 [Desulfotomaculum copahuensis]
MKPLLVELIYEGDHCIPCVYMLETVEEAMAPFGEQVGLELVYLRQKEGGRRYQALSEDLGKPAPIPSIFINGKLYFNITPPVEDLQETFRALLGPGE